MFIGGLAGLLPDTDTRYSILGRFIPVWLLCRHRRFTHSYISFFLLNAILSMYTTDKWIILAIMTGYLSHIWLDWLTPRGVWLWWPYGGFRSLKQHLNKGR